MEKTLSNPLILTLDAGGTNFEFTAMKDGEPVGESITLPANAYDLEACTQSLFTGFQQLLDQLEEPPQAISFAFPGPADYKNGVIGDLPNLPAFRGGVPLGPMLEHRFKIPVFINNDGDLFALGEAREGFLQTLNQTLSQEGSTRKYKNLIGVTLGTGFGVGIVVHGQLLQGDNNAAAEGWKLRNKQHSYTFIEDTVSTYALKRMYAEQIAIPPEKAPEPRALFEIASGKREGVREAALESFYQYGEALGDALATITTLIDGAMVIGGGISGAYPIFSRTMLDEMNGYFDLLNGERSSRLIQKVYNWEEKYSKACFLNESNSSVTIPGTTQKVPYQEEKKTVVGLSKLGTSTAIMKGAYYFAVQQLKGNKKGS